MIHIKPDGGRCVTFEDWSADMMQLSTRLYRLPSHPAYGGYGNHEVGIEQLARLKYGEDVIAGLCQFASELEHRPSDDELFALGQAWLAHKAEMALFRRSRANQGRRERQQVAKTLAKAAPTARFGFVRGV